MFVPWRWLFLILLGGSFATAHLVTLWWIAATATFYNQLLLRDGEPWVSIIHWNKYWSWEPWFNAGVLHVTVLVLLVGWFGFARVSLRRLHRRRLPWDAGKVPPL